MRGGCSAVAVFDGGGEFVVVGAVGGAEGSVVAVVPEGLAGCPPSRSSSDLSLGLPTYLPNSGVQPLSAALSMVLLPGYEPSARVTMPTISPSWASLHGCRMTSSSPLPSSKHSPTMRSSTYVLGPDLDETGSGAPYSS